METGVFFFSGTGNCFAAARKIAAHFNGNVIPITRALLESPIPAPERAVVVYPSYGYGAPSLVRRFFKRADFSASKYIAAVVSYGSKPGAAHLHAQSLLKSRGYALSYAGFLRGVENYIPIFGAPKEELKTERLGFQEEDTRAVIADIEAGKTGTVKRFQPVSLSVSVLFRSAKPMFAGLLYRVSDSCTGCTLCRDVCPAQAITCEKGERPDFIGSRCEHCQACLNFCPAKAITFGRLKKNTPRYRHPEINAADMKKAYAVQRAEAQAAESADERQASADGLVLNTNE